LNKPKTNQPQTPNETQERDFFFSPNYAIDLLVPFIPKRVKTIWEPAAGSGKIVKRLESTHGYSVVGSDIEGPYFHSNFLSDGCPFGCPNESSAIITNPPFSLKKSFYEQSRKWGVCFALLIPLDYSGWIIDALDMDGAEKIIPDSRINYITPNILRNIHENEVWNIARKEDSNLKGVQLKDAKKDYLFIFSNYMRDYENIHNYKNVEDCPSELLAKYSTSQFHSGWFTWGFDLGKSETFVHLSSEMKLNI